MKTIIVGGVAGGMSAATRLRRLMPDAEIVVLERGEHVSYANCGLPYHLGGVIADREELLLQTPQSLHTRFGLDVRVRTRCCASTATGTPCGSATATAGSTTSPTTAGARHRRRAPSRPTDARRRAGADPAYVEDVDRIVAALDARPRTAVVVGGGFIGLEVAENLVHRGLDVTVVERDDAGDGPARRGDGRPGPRPHLRRTGSTLRLGAALAAIGPDQVELADRRDAPRRPVVLLAIGVRPETRAGRATPDWRSASAGASPSTTAMRTSDPDIYAVGDAVEKPDAVDGAADAGPAGQHRQPPGPPRRRRHRRPAAHARPAHGHRASCGYSG